MKHSERGFVLVCVLWVLAIITVITIGFGRRAMLDLRGAQYTLNHSQAMAMARGAVERGSAEVMNKTAIDSLLRMSHATNMYGLSSATARYTSHDQEWYRPKDMLKEGYYKIGQDEDYKDEYCFAVITDGESKIDINRASKELLGGVEPLSFSAVRKIRQRRGLEESDEPVQSFLRLEELRYLEGVSDDDWYGKRDKPGLRDLLTCWGKHGRININTASKEVLLCVPDLGKDVVEAIVQYRQGGDGELGTADDRSFSMMDDVPLAISERVSDDDRKALQTYCKVDSRFFRITGYGTLRKGKIRAECSAIVSYGNMFEWQEGSFGS